MPRIYLSPPDVGDDERRLLLDAFDSNWIAPVGPHVDAFEQEMTAALGVRHAVALSSGTAALHLALLLAGVHRGDDVIVPTLTFAATAFAVHYLGARPVFIDADPMTWNIDPRLLGEELEARAASECLPAAVITVDLYGQCADYGAIRNLCDRYGVPLIEDAAEALGATYAGQAAGTFGDSAILSFNGNKVITTSAGGMFLSDREDWAQQARFLATQARAPALHYEHAAVGYNYRMSNLLAAVGRGQLPSLATKVDRRRAINARYRQLLSGIPGIDFMPEANYGRGTSWLTVITVDPKAFGADRDAVISRLAEHDIEGRPAWKPMHRQPVFADHPCRGREIADRIFDRGVCLPSGSSLADEEVDEVAGLVSSTRKRKRRPAAVPRSGC